ncbi:MAG: HEAT repeat domain-containing protein [Calothrix sp. SM1_7_51]|nr:HEAT repeat domain-containing protein [Calothrix sp. SM1_7_51]
MEELPKLSDDDLQWEYLNYLKWTEVVALMSGLLEDEVQVINLIGLALDIDLKLGAKLVGTIKQQFQEQSVEFIFYQKSIPLINKIIVLGETKSDYAIPYLISIFEASVDNGYYLAQKFVLETFYEIDNYSLDYKLWIILEEHLVNVQRILKNEFMDTSDFETELIPDDGVLDLDKIFRWYDRNHITKIYKYLLQYEDVLIQFYAAIQSFNDYLINDDIYFKYCLPILKHKNIYIRRTAIELLWANNKFAIFSLIQATSDESDIVCKAAIRKLAGLKNQDVIARLGELLQSEDLQIRELALDSLEKIGGENIVSVLCSFIQENLLSLYLLLQDENFDFTDSIESKLVEKAFIILKKINNIALINLFQSFLNYKEDLLHDLACLSLCKIGSLDIEIGINAFCRFINYRNYSFVIETISCFKKYQNNDLIHVLSNT